MSTFGRSRLIHPCSCVAVPRSSFRHCLPMGVIRFYGSARPLDFREMRLFHFGSCIILTLSSYGPPYIKCYDTDLGSLTAGSAITRPPPGNSGRVPEDSGELATALCSAAIGDTSHSFIDPGGYKYEARVGPAIERWDFNHIRWNPSKVQVSRYMTDARLKDIYWSAVERRTLSKTSITIKFTSRSSVRLCRQKSVYANPLGVWNKGLGPRRRELPRGAKSIR